MRAANIWIRFLDGEREEITIELVPMAHVVLRGGGWHDGYVPKPTRQQREQFGSLDSGDFAMECLVCWRYEGEEYQGQARWEDCEGERPRAFDWIWRDEACPCCGTYTARDNGCPAGCVPATKD